MAPEPLECIPETGDSTVYDRESVERFFRASSDMRSRLLREIAAARMRIAVKEAAAEVTPDGKFHSVQAVVEGQRLLRDEVRANRRAVGAITEWADAEVARILASAKERAGYELAANRVEAGAASVDPGLPRRRTVAARATAPSRPSTAVPDMTGRLPLPNVVEVIRSDAVDEAVAAVTEELEGLQIELDALRRRAHALELDAERLRRGASVSRGSSSMLERAFAEDAAVTRADLEAALEGARRTAERRIAAAGEGAGRWGAYATSTSPTPTSPTPTSLLPAHRRPASAPAFRRVPAVFNGASGGPDGAAETSTVRTVLDGGGAPTPGLHRNGEPTVIPGRHATTAGSEARPGSGPRPGPAFAEDPSRPADRFAQFWVAGEGADAPSRAKRSVVDVFLPVIAAAIVLMVVFSWVG